MGRAGVSRTNIPFFLPPYTLVSLFFISFFSLFLFFFDIPVVVAGFLRAPISNRFAEIRSVAFRLRDQCLSALIILFSYKNFFFFFFSDRTKNIEATQRGCPLRNTILPSCCFHIQKSQGYLDHRFSIEPDHHYHHPPPNPGSKMDASTSSSEKHDPKYSKFGAIC